MDGERAYWKRAGAKERNEGSNFASQGAHAASTVRVAV